ncbi:MAG: hypothetical protein J5985_03310 [Kiritimatiellae bacterium]|nr:hypothetical protein [Kiritimatiellia bacterium]
MCANERKNTSRSFKHECTVHPKNVVFYGDDVLCKVAEDASSLPEARGYALAGLLARYVLSPSRLGDGSAKKLLDAWLGADAVAMFHSLCILLERREKGMDADCLFRRLGQSLLRSIADVDMKAIESVIRPTVSADGFIPVFSSDDAYLLPFHFVNRQGSVATVTDAFGTEIPEWSRYLGELQSIQFDVIVDVRVEDGSQLTGDSLMLPLQVAAWRREGAMQFPQYSILRLYATGSLHGGRLGFVDTKEKESKVGEIDNALFVRPVNCSQDTPDRRGQLHAGTPLKRCRSAIAEWAETMTVCDPSYAIKRLDDFDKRVRTAKGQDWKTVCMALENLTGGFDKELEPESYLQGLMIRSAAACHSGKTEEAERLNKEAETFASGKKEYEKDILRLRIEQLVIMQDMEDFQGAQRLSAGVRDALDAYKDETSLTLLDLRMRYHGTMGQLLSAMIISGRFSFESGCDAKAEALRHCERAYKTAQELYRKVSERNPSREELFEATTNIVQDANYLVMWSALHDFKSLEKHADDARKKAERLCGFDSGENHVGSECCRVNAGYRERFKLMGWYRELIKGNSIDEVFGHVEEGVFEDDKVEFWVRALGKKYIGAFEAARGNFEKAEQYFRQAHKILETCRAGIIGVIHMTILAETFRSLRNTPYAEFSENARRKALELLDAPENAEWHKEAWKEYLQDPDGRPYPALTYWY